MDIVCLLLSNYLYFEDIRLLYSEAKVRSNSPFNVSADLRDLRRNVDSLTKSIPKTLGLLAPDPDDGTPRYKIHFHMSRIGMWLDLRKLRSAIIDLEHISKSLTWSLSSSIRLRGITGIQPIVAAWCVNFFLAHNSAPKDKWLKLVIDESVHLKTRYLTELDHLWKRDHGTEMPPWSAELQQQLLSEEEEACRRHNSDDRNHQPPPHSHDGPSTLVPQAVLEDDSLDWRTPEFFVELCEFIGGLLHKGDSEFVKQWVSTWLDQRFHQGSLIPIRFGGFYNF